MTAESEISKQEDDRLSAMVRGDIAALEAMTHDQLLYTHASGNVDTKATWLAAMQSGRTRYKSTQCDDVQIRILGDAALVTGKAVFDVEINGQPRTLKMKFLNVWSKTSEGWKFAAWQATPITQ
jgi:ketosteroid isomerase-like protein